MNYILVVPDGILSSIDKQVSVSNTYKAAIDLAFNEALLTSASIVLLPANSFNTDRSEQEYARDYLLEKHFDSDRILIGNSSKNGYIATRDNFLLALKYGFTNCGNLKYENIDNNIKKGNYTIVSSHLHIDRTLLIIKLLKCNHPKKIMVSYADESKNIVKRLFFYRFPLIRMLYELTIIVFILAEIRIKVIMKFIENIGQSYVNE